MASDLTRVSVSSQRAETEFDLLQVILSDEPYPWSAETIDQVDSLTVMESQWEHQLSEEEEEAIATHRQNFFQHLEQVWFAADHPLQTPLHTKLQEAFQDRVSAEVIHHLVQKAQRLAHQPISLADQLVQCVQDVFAGWEMDDLQVLARPYAFAMRSPDTDPLDTTASAVRSVDWSELSEVEQVRLSLAIARYALDQLNQPHG